MNWPPDRHGDNRWNQCLDALIAAWNRVGPDVTLATASRRIPHKPDGTVRRTRDRSAPSTPETGSYSLSYSRGPADWPEDPCGRGPLTAEELAATGGAVMPDLRPEGTARAAAT